MDFRDIPIDTDYDKLRKIASERKIPPHTITFKYQAILTFDGKEYPSRLFYTKKEAEEDAETKCLLTLPTQL